jgi:UDP-GlcNAc:undecaprenyl-phosphate GlcNAc-1-phosphate transferase
LAGFTLGFLAIVSGAKIAIALAVLAIPIADAALVVLGRLRRGDSPWKGDATHLHFRLLNLGISHRMVVALLWGVSMAAGVMALTLQTRGKIFLLSTLVVLTALASWLASRKIAKT